MIRLSLTIKWILTLLLSSMIGIVIVGAFAYWTTATQFDRFLDETIEQDFVRDAIQYYERNNSWSGINQYLSSIREDSDVPGNFTPQRHSVVSVDHIVLAGAGPLISDQPLPDEFIQDLIPLTSNGDTVGYALIAGPPRALLPPERNYLDNTNRALFVGILGASVVSIVVGILLSRQLLLPLSQLTQAIFAMKSGDLHQQVVVNTKDELEQLANAFNQMSAELHRANQLRQQMTADIAHDLRTPLHVISGYIEAMRDGSLPVTTERFDTINNETNLLKRLVEDLRTLSLADAGELKLILQNIQANELLIQVRDTFEPLAKAQDVHIQIETTTNLPLLRVDTERIIQVLTNLVSNALRYTPVGGSVTMSATSTENTVELRVQDTGVGIPEDQLGNIFERFYRIDEARSENYGESGLGLAIVKSIVEAHGGNIRATSQLNEGTIFIVTLPIK